VSTQRASIVGGLEAASLWLVFHEIGVPAQECLVLAAVVAIGGKVMTFPATHKNSRVILAKPRAIFRTMLDPETIPAWRLPSGVTAQIEHFDSRPGGAYRIAFQQSREGPEESESSKVAGVVDGRFAEILPDERIVESVRFDIANPPSQGELSITTILEQVKDGTKVTIAAADVPSGISEGDCRAGMDMMLKKLANFVE